MTQPIRYAVFWRAVDHPALFEAEEFENEAEARTYLAEWHSRCPKNTYWLTRIEHIEWGKS
jgi:hypothetical protein